MIENDTIKLLRECDSGVKMGIKSIDDVLDHIKSKELLKLLYDCKDEHVRLDREITEQLNRYKDEGKEPSIALKGMSWIKTNIKLAANNTDSTVADLMTQGCNMGVKSLNRYLNEYKAADEVSKDIAKKLIKIEEDLVFNIKGYL